MTEHADLVNAARTGLTAELTVHRVSSEEVVRYSLLVLAHTVKAADPALSSLTLEPSDQGEFMAVVAASGDDVESCDPDDLADSDGLYEVVTMLPEPGAAYADRWKPFAVNFHNDLWALDLDLIIECVGHPEAAIAARTRAVR